MTTVPGLSALPVEGERPWFRNALVRLLGWRGLLLQSDPPTWDRWRWVRRHLRRSPGRVLDAGSGSGGFALAAASRGHEVVGLSFDSSANALAVERGGLLELPNATFVTCDLRRLDELAPVLGRFNQILCLETIEHLIEDERLVRTLAGLLEPGGSLLLSTPTIQHQPLVGERLSETEDGGHVRWGYSTGQLQQMFRRAGLNLVQVDYLSGIITQTLTNLARWLGRHMSERAAWAITAPLQPLRLLDRPLSSVLRHPWLAVAAVGVKS